jgi:acyl phosphate:glycerol-3-phosphate acyltransferase
LEFSVNTILTFLIFYLIGSFPTGYLFVRTIFMKDITKEGSGNVGTLNALEVSGSKLVGIVVLIIDFLKGAAPVLILVLVFNENVMTVYLSSVFLILGHNYPVWLKFKGGRGLAASAGIFAVLNYWVLLSWCLIWLGYFMFKKNLLMSNFFATLFLPLFAIALDKFNVHSTIKFLNHPDYNFFVVFVICVSLLVLFKHGDVFSKILPLFGKNLDKQ